MHYLKFLLALGVVISGNCAFGAAYSQAVGRHKQSIDNDRFKKFEKPTNDKAGSKTKSDELMKYEALEADEPLTLNSRCPKMVSFWSNLIDQAGRGLSGFIGSLIDNMQPVERPDVLLNMPYEPLVAIDMPEEPVEINKQLELKHLVEIHRLSFFNAINEVFKRDPEFKSACTFRPGDAYFRNTIVKEVNNALLPEIDDASAAIKTSKELENLKKMSDLLTIMLKNVNTAWNQAYGSVTRKQDSKDRVESEYRASMEDFLKTIDAIKAKKPHILIYPESLSHDEEGGSKTILGKMKKELIHDLDLNNNPGGGVVHFGSRKGWQDERWVVDKITLNIIKMIDSVKTEKELAVILAKYNIIHQIIFGLKNVYMHTKYDDLIPLIFAHDVGDVNIDNIEDLRDDSYILEKVRLFFDGLKKQKSLKIRLPLNVSVVTGLKEVELNLNECESFTYTLMGDLINEVCDEESNKDGFKKLVLVFSQDSTGKWRPFFFDKVEFSTYNKKINPVTQTPMYFDTQVHIYKVGKNNKHLVALCSTDL